MKKNHFTDNNKDDDNHDNDKRLASLSVKFLRLSEKMPSSWEQSTHHENIFTC